jgi:hypothetical protein
MDVEAFSFSFCLQFFEIIEGDRERTKIEEGRGNLTCVGDLLYCFIKEYNMLLRGVSCYKLTMVYLFYYNNYFFFCV